MHSNPDDEAILAIARPHKDLLKYYLIASLAAGPFFLIPMIYGAIRFQTMRYRFTDEGISMSWGILFRREIIIQYSRIQDIHLRSNVVERWLGLARVLIQTASGSASAEMTLEGLKEFEAVRDYLYSRMRGVKDDHRTTRGGDAREVGGPGMGTGKAESIASAGASGVAVDPELAAVLRDVAAELRALRADLAAKAKEAPDA